MSRVSKCRFLHYNILHFVLYKCVQKFVGQILPVCFALLKCVTREICENLLYVINDKSNAHITGILRINDE